MGCRGAGRRMSSRGRVRGRGMRRPTPQPRAGGGRAAGQANRARWRSWLLRRQVGGDVVLFGLLYCTMAASTGEEGEMVWCGKPLNGPSGITEAPVVSCALRAPRWLGLVGFGLVGCEGERREASNPARALENDDCHIQQETGRSGLQSSTDKMGCHRCTKNVCTLAFRWCPAACPHPWL